MSAHTIETESTFDAPSDLVVADLVHVHGVGSIAAPVVHDLDAEYFDTADLSLLAADIGLRRRRGGDDEGWHLAIGRSTGERVEVHRPLEGTRGQPPQDLCDLVVARSRRAPLTPVARLRTRRTVHRLLDDAGAPLAEVAEDDVVADVPGRAPISWREIEVELTGGDAELLDAVGRELVDQGATPAAASSELARALGDRPVVERGRARRPRTAGDAVAAHLRAEVAALVDVDPAVRIDAEDAVHTMRVAARRLRSALATYRRLLDVDVTEPIRAELKWLGGVLGPARDAEVLRDHLREALAAEPPALVVGPVRRRVDATLSGRHEAAHRRAVAELTSLRYTRLLAALDQLPDTVTGPRADRPARAGLAAEVRRAHRRMRRQLRDALDAPHDDERLHDVRKAAKRVRYAAESARPVLGRRAGRLATRMEEAQDLLGAHQDTVVSRQVLRQLARDADAADESTFTYGRLHASEQRRGEDARDAFLALVDDGWGRRPGWLG